jgi:hypothetical protein
MKNSKNTSYVFVVISAEKTKFHNDTETLEYHDEISVISVHMSLQSAVTSLGVDPLALGYSNDYNTDSFTLGETWLIDKYKIVKRELIK